MLGEAIWDYEIPENLYVPTPPLWIESNRFKGPLDLLWHLIRKQNIDILDIPVGLIAAQYVQYLKLMTAQRFEVAPDYLVMAVRLLQIKSQMMLPKQASEQETEEDPRALLIKQLTDYEVIQFAAQFLDELPRWNRDLWVAQCQPANEMPPPALPDVELNELMLSYVSLIQKKKLVKEHVVERPRLTLSDRMNSIYHQLQINVPTPFYRVVDASDASLDIAISFQAVLELAKNQQIDLHQIDWNDLLWLNRIS